MIKTVEDYKDIPDSYTPYSRGSYNAVRKTAKKFSDDGRNVLINKNDVWAGKHTGTFHWQVFVENW